MKASAVLFEHCLIYCLFSRFAEADSEESRQNVIFMFTVLCLLSLSLTAVFYLSLSFAFSASLRI